jgi:hypothetical protein
MQSTIDGIKKLTLLGYYEGLKNNSILMFVWVKVEVTAFFGKQNNNSRGIKKTKRKAFIIWCRLQLEGVDSANGVSIWWENNSFGLWQIWKNLIGSAEDQVFRFNTVYFLSKRIGSTYAMKTVEELPSKGEF